MQALTLIYILVAILIVACAAGFYLVLEIKKTRQRIDRLNEQYVSAH